ncbi:MAG: hypothetical protein IAF08_00845, partial [Rhizobacter sp.]|nr:hypothetical protein [Chlorobiales bacterium]
MKNFTDYQDFEMKPGAGYAAALGATEAFKKQWQEKLKTNGSSLSVTEKQRLHSMQLWLAVLHEVADTIGPKACFDIGKSVAKNIELPYDADTI